MSFRALQYFIQNAMYIGQYLYLDTPIIHLCDVHSVHFCYLIHNTVFTNVYEYFLVTCMPIANHQMLYIKYLSQVLFHCQLHIVEKWLADSFSAIVRRFAMSDMQNAK